MSNDAPDKANVIALPPLLYAIGFFVGWLIHITAPVRFLPPTVARWLGVALMAMSIPLALWALKTLSSANTTFDTMKPTTAIVTDGPFRYSRNPMYVSLTLFYLGTACLMNALWILLLVVPILVVMQRGVIAREEAYLTRKFGNTYLRYKARVRRWI